MKTEVRVLALIALGSAGAYAASCGTLSGPLACSITVGGTTTYTFTAFSFVNNFSSGGGILYTGSDVAIDLATGGGLTALLTFTKSNTNPGVVFAANAGESTSFTFTYTATLSAAAPGTVAFGTPFIVGVNGTNLNNGLGAVQLIVSGVTSCQAIVVVTPQANCTIPGGQPLFLNTGNITNLAGNTGNVSIGSFTNLYSATFTPTGVPEPSTFTLLGLGIGGIAGYRLRRRRV